MSSGVEEAGREGKDEEETGENEDEEEVDDDKSDEKGTKVEEHGRRNGPATEAGDTMRPVWGMQEKEHEGDGPGTFSAKDVVRASCLPTCRRRVRMCAIQEAK